MGHLKSSYQLPGHLSYLGKLPIEFYLLKILNDGPNRHNDFNLVDIRRRHLLTAGEAKAIRDSARGRRVAGATGPSVGTAWATPPGVTMSVSPKVKAQ